MKLARAKSVPPAAAGATPVADNQSGGIDHCNGILSIRSPPCFHSNMTNQSTNTATGPGQKNFEHVLSREPFKGLKAILDSLSPNREALCEGVNGANSYEDLL